MDSIRLNKVSRLLQKELGGIFQREARNLFGGKMITVTKVNVTPDLSVARVNLSIFPSENTEEIVTEIRLLTKQIRHALAQIVGKQLRKIPELQFFLDDSLDYIERIDELLKE